MTITNTATESNGKARTVRASADETREEKFVRLAIARITAARRKIRQIKNLAKYPHTDQQAARVISEINTLAAEVEEAFAPTEQGDEFRF